MGNSAKTAPIVGIFNNRTFFSTPMEKLKNGAFTISFVQDGHGMLPLLSYSLKNSVLIKLLNLIFGLVVGGILFALGL